MGYPNKITKLIEKRQKINKEIENIQNSCNHSMKSIKLVKDRVDSSIPVVRWVCDECFKTIGYPTQQEKDEFFK